jgi:glycosyltransferase involved in cell wall biosynthesis
MKVFVIQPNYAAKSEAWLHRMNQMLEGHICGTAAYLSDEITLGNSFPIFNLNGRSANNIERLLTRLRLNKYDAQKTMQKELFELFAETKADVLLVHYATVADEIWDVLNKCRLPIYIYVHGYDIIWDQNDNNGNRIHNEKYAERVLAISQSSNVKFIAASNCSIQNLLLLGIDKNKIYKKTFGVDLANGEKDYTKKTMTVLFLGRFVDYKGPDIVLQAFLKACDLGFKGKLIMAGDGPLKSMCELISKRSKYRNQIQFTGEVSQHETALLFETADIYTMHNCKGLLSNGYDTFGVSIIEAMSFGLPIVTAGFGGPSEIIDNRVDGILVEENNILSHAEALIELYQSPLLRAALGNNAKKKVLNKYNSEIEKKELFQILQINPVS